MPPLTAAALLLWGRCAGTAGLRAKMGPGFSRMNAVTVQQASQGLAAYLHDTCGERLAAGERWGGAGGHELQMPCAQPQLHSTWVLGAQELLSGFTMTLAPTGGAAAPPPPAGGVVVGHDARHHSLSFALIVAGVFLARGVRVHLLRGPCPTPWVAAGVSQLGAAAGVVVTASHNPKVAGAAVWGIDL